MRKIYILIALLFITSLSAKSRKSDNVQMLINKGDKEYNSGNYSNSLMLYMRAELLVGNEDYTRISYIKNVIGKCYVSLSDYDKALIYFDQALSLAKKHNLTREKVVILSNIGVLYASDENYNDAIAAYKKAIKSADEINSDYVKDHLIINISDAYNKTKRYKEAQKYLGSIKNPKKFIDIAQSKTINYAESLLIEGKPLIALDTLKYLDIAYFKSKKIESLNLYVYLSELMAKIHFSLNNNDLSIYYADKCLIYTNDLKTKINIYTLISEVNTRKNDYKSVIKYKDSVIFVKDSLARLISRGLYQSSKAKVKIQEYKNVLKANTEKNRQQRTIFTITVLMIILITIGIYLWLKSKIIKQKHEKILLDNKQKIAGLELENLKNDIAEKNRNIAVKALFVSDRNSIISEVINSLSDIPEILNNNEVKSYVDKLKDYIKSDNNWEDFVHYFEQINPKFMKALHIKHPELNNKEIRFLCYIYMNLDMKEISNILNITYNSAMKKLYRIKKKMDISEDLHITEYLLQIA